MSQAIKYTKVTFKKVESEWYNYHHTIKELQGLREMIMTPFDEESEDMNIIKGVNSVRQPGDPTSNIASRLATNKQINYLEQIISAIDQVYKALPDDYKKLVKIRYWGRNKMTWEEISRECFISKRTAMRRRNEVVEATIEVLGWR